MAHPAQALLSLIAAVEALATVILVSIKVHAPLSAASLARRAATNLVIPRLTQFLEQHWESLLHSLPKRLQSSAQAIPGKEAKAAPRRAHPSTLEPCPSRGCPLRAPLQARRRRTLWRSYQSGCQQKKRRGVVLVGLYGALLALASGVPPPRASLKAATPVA